MRNDGFSDSNGGNGTSAAGPRMRGEALLLLACVTLGGSGWVSASVTGTGGGAPPCLLLYDCFGTSPCPTPKFIRDHLAFLENLPFDGIAVYLRNPDLSDNVTLVTMTNQPLGYPAISRVLAPLKGVLFKSMTQNLAVILSNKPPDFFNDWSIIIQNFSDLARACREAGLKGIFFDNTNYFAKWSSYPEGVEYPVKCLKEYREQARLRGKQLMEAMVSQFPEIVVLTVHGPYLSEPKAPAALFPQWQAANQLTAAFFCGFVEGTGKRAVCVDGGQLYKLRTPKDFQDAYEWRKSTIASDKINCESIPQALRPLWAARVSIAFGVSNRPFGEGDMLPSIVRDTLGYAIQHSDRYVWFGVEGPTFLRPSQAGGAADYWIDAVRKGRWDSRRKVSHP